MMVHGGTGANDIVIMGLLEKGDNIVVIKPTYQQHYDIPKSMGIETRIVSTKRRGRIPVEHERIELKLSMEIPS